ncbi:MAG: hypothetical protein QOD77_478 [Thermoplasmata archaeon]|jgi:hypothetical protein|nr:hypothetical protein [Thermoplasmata archaeon]
MEGMRPSASAAEAQPPPPHTPVERLNRILARPVAAVFMVLGFPPSVQSLWITILGVLYFADAVWSHLLQGAALVYLGLVFDRAENLITERKGRPQVWSQFFGLAIDRLVEAALLVGLAVVAARGVTDSPIPVWAPLGLPVAMAVVCGAAGLLMVLRALQLHSEILLLRLHLIQTRRLPGPALVARGKQARARWGAVFGRDEMVLLVCVGLALGQPQATAVALLAALLVATAEAMVLFRMRLREPEPEASRLLGPDYP